jgi:hypothetical protein
MKNSLNEPERPQSQALYYKVKATFQFSPQGETGMNLTPALSRPTGEGESFAVAGEKQGAVFTRPSQECRETFECGSLRPSDGRGVRGEGRRAL